GPLDFFGLSEIRIGNCRWDFCLCSYNRLNSDHTNLGSVAMGAKSGAFLNAGATLMAGVFHSISSYRTVFERATPQISPCLPRVRTYTSAKSEPLPESVGLIDTMCWLSSVPTFSSTAFPVLSPEHLRPLES